MENGFRIFGFKLFIASKQTPERLNKTTESKSARATTKMRALRSKPLGPLGNQRLKGAIRGSVIEYITMTTGL
jgi:hypothetical protein